MGAIASVLDRIKQPKYTEWFNEVGPYYTSYPTLGLWSELDHDSYVKTLEAVFEKDGEDTPLALYVHIPFCAKLCWYCICNLRITNDREVKQKFVDHLVREIDLLHGFFQDRSIIPNIREIHLGGGTPSHLERDQVSQIMDKLKMLVDAEGLQEVAMEIDPRITTAEDLRYYSKEGVDRISFGVQDFDPDVQQAINRVQPPEMVAELLPDDVRALFTGVNFDLLYGLPLQSPATFERTIELVHELSPERVSLLKYAHVPDVRKHMKMIKEDDLPDMSRFPAIFTNAVESFLDKGYEWIGIDNFAKKADVLAEAARNRTLSRDFNGWNVGRTKHLIGLGPTTTTAFGGGYFQALYGQDEYYREVNKSKFPVLRGYKLTEDDKIRRALIFRLLCHQYVNLDAIDMEFGIDSRTYFVEELESLQNAYSGDDIVSLTEEGIVVTHFGRFFLRNVCRHFDSFWKEKEYKVTGP